MTSDRLQRRIESLLDEADAAVGGKDWPAVPDAIARVLAIDASNAEALAYRAMASADGSDAATPRSDSLV